MSHEGSARRVYVEGNVLAVVENNTRLYIDYTVPKISVEVGSMLTKACKIRRILSLLIIFDLCLIVGAIWHIKTLQI